MPKFIFNKLIRDKILQLHKDAGHVIEYRHIGGTEFKEKLRLKLHEESDEVPIRGVADQEVIEELADVQQVLDDLKQAYELTDEQIQQAQTAKYEKKGGFTRGIFVESVELSESDQWVDYYRKSPEKYPEVLDV